MAPDDAPDHVRVPTSNIGIAETARDRMWEFQLRKENKAMLQEIRNAAKQRELEQAEIDRTTRASTELLATIEARLAALENAYKEDQKGREKFMDDAARFRAQMTEFLSARFNEDHVRYIVEGGSNSVHSVPTTPNTSPSVDPRPADPRLIRSLAAGSHDLTPQEEQLFRKPPPRTIPRALPGPNELCRPSTRSRSRPKPPTRLPANATLVPSPQGSIIPIFSQGKMTLTDYFMSASTLFHKTPHSNRNVSFDADYVNSFLYGISNKMIREKMVEDLQQVHPSRMTKRGVEIVCEWDDMEYSLREGGLLVMIAAKEQNASKRKGRIMNPNPRGLIETNF